MWAERSLMGPSALMATGIAFITLLLAGQLLIQAPASRFISVDMAINHYVTNAAALIGNLYGAPLF